MRYRYIGHTILPRYFINMTNLSFLIDKTKEADCLFSDYSVGNVWAVGVVMVTTCPPGNSVRRPEILTAVLGRGGSGVRSNPVHKELCCPKCPSTLLRNTE